MKRIHLTSSGVFWITAVVLAVALAFVWAAAAHAQDIQDDQYGTPATPSGPAAGLSVAVFGDTDGIVNEGDLLVIEGDFTVSEGSSVIVEDSDGTQGTFVDGDNADITEGSIEIAVTADPDNVNGGDGVLSTEGLTVVATTGISAGSSFSDEGSVLSAVTGTLPDTGGPALLAAIGVLAASGTGLMLLRRRVNG